MKIKNECDLISDLMLGYADNVLTETSKELVDEHIQSCDNCKKKLKNILKDTEEDSQEVEIDYLKNVKRKISKKNKYIVLIGIILFIVILLNVIVFVNYNMKGHEISIVLQDNVTEEELKQIENIVLTEDSEAEITYVSKEEAFKKTQEKFKQIGTNINGAEDMFPAEYHIKTDIEHIQKIEDKLVSIPSIRSFCTTTRYNPYEFLLDELLLK